MTTLENIILSDKIFGRNLMETPKTTCTISITAEFLLYIFNTYIAERRLRLELEVSPGKVGYRKGCATCRI